MFRRVSEYAATPFARRKNRRSEMALHLVRFRVEDEMAKRGRWRSVFISIGTVMNHRTVRIKVSQLRRHGFARLILNIFQQRDCSLRIERNKEFAHIHVRQRRQLHGIPVVAHAVEAVSASESAKVIPVKRYRK